MLKQKGKKMRNYIISIIGLALVFGVFEAMLPKGGRTVVFLKLLISLCILVVMINPIMQVVEYFSGPFTDDMGGIISGDGGTSDEYQKAFELELEEAVRGEVCRLVKKSLTERFGADGESCDVGVLLSEGAERVERLIITLKGRDIFRNPYNIEEYFSELLECECIVVIG